MWARLCLAFGILLFIASSGTLIGGKILIARYTGAVHQDSLLDPNSKHHGSRSVTGPLNILVAGIDYRRGDPTSTQASRSDSIMIIHIPASHDRAYLLSVPRDTIADIPADQASGSQEMTTKINSAFAFGMGNKQGRSGGFKLLSKTITNLTGVTFDIGAVIDWYGFTGITGQLGGVTMCLDKGFTSTQPGMVGARFPAGCHHYDKDNALLLVRQREDLPGGDFDRQRLQQQFVKQILKEAMSRGVVSNPLKLDGIVKAVGNSVTMDLNGYGFVDLALALKDIRPESIIPLQMPRGADVPCGYGCLGVGLKQPDASDLFSALKSDQLDAFIASHPGLVNRIQG